jgi:hypothetical protein
MVYHECRDVSQTINGIQQEAICYSYRSGGCSASFTNNVTMQPLPVVNFTATDACWFLTTVNNTSLIASEILLTGHGISAMAFCQHHRPIISILRVVSYIGCNFRLQLYRFSNGTIQIDPLPTTFTAVDVVKEMQCSLTTDLLLQVEQ